VTIKRAEGGQTREACRAAEVEISPYMTEVKKETSEISPSSFTSLPDRHSLLVMAF